MTAARSRSLTRRILPVAVVGYPVTITIRRGRLNEGRPSLQNSIRACSSARAPGLSWTKAMGFSSPSVSFAATTTAWATSACASRRDSTSAGETQAGVVPVRVHDVGVAGAQPLALEHLARGGVAGPVSGRGRITPDEQGSWRTRRDFLAILAEDAKVVTGHGH